MAIDQQFLDEIERKLDVHSPTLSAEYRLAVAELQPALSESDFRLWAEEGAELAAHSLRSWEAAVDYFRASPEVWRRLPSAAFRRWAHAGRDLAEYSSVVAASYFRASPMSIRYLNAETVVEWAALGKRLYKGHWKSISLSTVYFSASPGILPSLTLGEMARLVSLIESVAERSYELASACLDASPHLFASLSKSDRAPFLTLASAVGEASWADVRICFERSPNLLSPIETTARSRFLSLASQVARRSGRHAYGLFSEGAMALANVPRDSHHDLLSMAEELAAASPSAAMEFLKSSPEVLKRIRISELAGWHAAGHKILAQSVEGGEAYFRLESGKGEQVLQQLSSRVELDARRRGAAPLLQGAHRHQRLHPPGVVPRRKRHRLGEREPPQHRGHDGLPARVRRGVRRARPELLGLQGVRDAPGGAPGVRQLLLPLPARRRHVARPRARSWSASASRPAASRRASTAT